MPENVLVYPTNTAPGALKNEQLVTVKATDVYRGGLGKKLLQGKNYRMAWDAPVEAPVLRLDVWQGGLKILKEGGGDQTRSLDLAAPDGTMYTLRSVCKDATGLVPPVLKSVGNGNLILDAISAGHPYGALPAAALAEAAGVLHTHPQLVFMPAQPMLDTLTEKYGNRLFLLEYEPEGSQFSWLEKIPDAQKLLETEDVSKAVQENTLHRADQENVLYARLLDLVIGDWDRHEGNWGWVAYRKDRETRYAPIAADRDNAFFKIDGAVPWLVNRSFFQPKFRGFRKKIYYLPGMLVNSDRFDAMHLNRMQRADFQEAALRLQAALPDSLVEKSIRVLPDSVYALDGKGMEEKVKARRDDLVRYAEKFYRLLAKKPQVYGTEGEDRFVLKPLPGRRLQLQIFTRYPDSLLHYERIFSARETRHLNLFALGGDDLVEVLDGPVRYLKIRVDGGDGRDRFLSISKKKSSITFYDKKKEMTLPDGYRLKAEKLDLRSKLQKKVDEEEEKEKKEEAKEHSSKK